MNDVFQTFRNIGATRLAALAIVAVCLMVFFGFLTTQIASQPMALLYADLDPQDAGAIARKLDGLKIKYEVAPTGGSIRVPADQVGRLRMEMAADGLPKGGSIGYEIFDQKEGFGTTSFVQNINHLRALEGELARTISTISAIQSARVHLVLPQRELFSHNEQKPTASVFLKTRGNSVLTREQVAGIQNLIAAAVPQLQPTQISIVDSQGTLLARPRAPGTLPGGGDVQEWRATFEQAQARKVEDLLSQSVGYGKVRAQVSAEFDMDRVTTNSETYDPDSQVARSTQNTSENASNAEGASEGVSIANNLPGTPGGAPGGTSGGTSTTNNKTEETTNYEINKTVRSQVREPGQLKRLSVAVLVDGITTEDKDGKAVYQPRPKGEILKIRALVRSALNLDFERGDTLEVQEMPFVQAEAGTVSETPKIIAGLPMTELVSLGKTLVLALLGFLAILIVVRPLLRRFFDNASAAVGTAPSAKAGGAAAATALQGPHLGDVAAGEGGASAAASEPEPTSEIERMIDLSRIEGRVKASSVNKVAKIVEEHPEKAVAILRTWMYQEKGGT